MRATVIYGPGEVRVEDRPDPAITAPTDAIVRVVRACVCGSDLHPYHSMAPVAEGRTIGHEFIGVVEEVGAAVRQVRPGDFVISPFAWSDNTCAACRDGVQTACRHGGFFSAAQSEAVRVPQADGTLVVTEATADEDLLKSLLTLSDVYLTGYHAAFVGRVGPGKTVTVVGDGAVGLSAVLAARQLSAERIILMGRHTERTDLGREFGATDVVAERGAEGVERVLELTAGEGSHVVLEAVGHLPAFEQCLGVVRPGGVISRVGVPQFETAPVGFGGLFGRNITLNGGPAPVRAYLEQTIPKVLDGTINPGRVFDRVMTLEEAPQAYAAMDSRAALKVMLTP
ncbi:zinc-binding dehydrogenase [Nostocoides sp.]|uniref:zinc-binding dehydrogenase n=1 Tax=Nostocoides sp. TaxID=1917966 RepID=UPI002C369FB4|nr:alcohol dehydrogenase catalytic domain-containing protein [Tetrasphaera sp.]